MILKTTMQVLDKLVIPTSMAVLVKAQSVDKKLKVKLLHMTASNTDDMKSFYSITELDQGKEVNEVLDEFFNGKLNFALLSLANCFHFFHISYSNLVGSLYKVYH